MVDDNAYLFTRKYLLKFRKCYRIIATYAVRDVLELDNKIVWFVISVTITYKSLIQRM